MLLTEKSPDKLSYERISKLKINHVVCISACLWFIINWIPVLCNEAWVNRPKKEKKKANKETNRNKMFVNCQDKQNHLKLCTKDNHSWAIAHPQRKIKSLKLIVNEEIEISYHSPYLKERGILGVSQMIQIDFAKIQCDRLWIWLPFYLFIVYSADFVFSMLKICSSFVIGFKIMGSGSRKSYEISSH